MIAKPPCVGIKLPSDRRPDQMNFLTASQVRELAEAIETRYQALIYTAAYSGLRAGELHALRRTSVDTTAGTIAVVAAASEVRGQLRYGPTKTGKRRLVGVPRRLLRCSPTRWSATSRLMTSCSQHMEGARSDIGTSIVATLFRLSNVLTRGQSKKAGNGRQSRLSCGSTTSDTPVRPC